MQVKIISECSKGEHPATLSTFNKLQFAIKTVVLSIFELLLKTGFTVFFSQIIGVVLVNPQASLTVS